MCENTGYHVNLTSEFGADFEENKIDVVGLLWPQAVNVKSKRDVSVIVLIFFAHEEYLGFKKRFKGNFVEN